MFQIRLAIRPGASSSKSVASSSKKPISRRVLIVEDNADAAGALRMLLASRGHEVVTAGDGVEGLQRAREFKPEVVLCDIGLPGEIDGYAFARTIRSEPALRSTLLVAITGYGMFPNLSLDAGFDVHLTKPASPEALDDVLERLPKRA